MRIGPTILHNFGPFPHAEFDFSKPGLTGIEGVMHDRPGCTSNGSGKSKLIGGISWVLFDDPMCAGWAKDDVIRLQFQPTGSGELGVVMDGLGKKPRRPDDGCYGIVHIVGGVHQIRVERYRGHPIEKNRAKLFIDGRDETRGRDSMTNLAIEEALGMDYRAFSSSIAFGAREDVRSFFSAADSERKEILDKLLGMEVYAVARKNAMAKLRTTAAELEEAERKERSLQERIGEQERVIAELAGSEELAELAWQWKWQRARVVLARFQEARLKAFRDEMSAGLREQQRIADVILEEHRAEVEAVRAKLRKLEGRRREVSEQRGEQRAVAQAAAKDIERWGKLGGTQCPTCAQSVSRMIALRTQRASIVRRDAALEEMEKADVLIADLRTAIEEYVEPEAPLIPAKGKAEQAVRDADDALSDWQAWIREEAAVERAAKQAFNKAKGQGDQLTARLAELREELRFMVEETTGALRLRADQLEFWVEGFGPGGLRSFLIEAEVPEVNRIATRFAQRLLGSGSVVQLSATRELATGASKEELTVAATIPGCTLSYAGASKGQRRRLDLALLLAFRDIAARRAAKSFGQLFADELFDGLDEAGEESVIELLREISKDCPVVLVTHSDALKSAADRLVVVHHRDGTAELEEIR